MSNSKVTPAQSAAAMRKRAKIAAARATVRECVAAERAAAATVRDTRSALNRAMHRATPVRVSASAVAAVTGAAMADGASARVTVTDAHAVKYVSLRPLVGVKVTFSRTGDAYVAIRPVATSPEARAHVAAERAHVAAVKRTATARAAVKRASGGAVKSPAAAAEGDA